MDIPNPIDEQYEKLNCNIKTVPAKAKEFDMINTYIQNTS